MGMLNKLDLPTEENGVPIAPKQPWISSRDQVTAHTHTHTHTRKKKTVFRVSEVILDHFPQRMRRENREDMYIFDASFWITCASLRTICPGRKSSTFSYLIFFSKLLCLELKKKKKIDREQGIDMESFKLYAFLIIFSLFLGFQNMKFRFVAVLEKVERSYIVVIN